MKGGSERSIFNVWRVKIFVPVISSKLCDHPFPNLFLCSSNFADEQYLSFLVFGSYHFSVSLLLVYPGMILLVSYHLTFYEKRLWVMCHIQSFLVHKWWVSFHNMQIEVRCFIKNYGYFTYRLLMMFLLHSTIFFMLIIFNKTFSNHGVNASVVYFVISVDPWCVTTSSFHGDAEVINYKVGNICLFFQGAILFNYHTCAWMLFII